MSHVQITRWAHCQRQVAFLSICGKIRPVLIFYLYVAKLDQFYLILSMCEPRCDIMAQAVHRTILHVDI